MNRSDRDPVVAIFGGSFNPPHVAHVLLATLVLSTHDVDRLLVVPTFRHPFAKPLAPFEDRVAMCEHAMGFLPNVEVSRVEEVLGGESRTLRTLEHLKETHPTWKLRLIMGADLIAESSKWFGFAEICAIAPPIILGRKGTNVSDAPIALLPEISSTDVRNKIAESKWDDLSAIVPRLVIEHIRSHALYTR